jgi:hypothetical protein
VLIAGSDAAVSLYNPAGDFWQTMAPLLDGNRQGCNAPLLPNGKVLITSGIWPGSLSSPFTELYDALVLPNGQSVFGPNIFTGTQGNSPGGNGHAATLLSDGNVLISGGSYARYTQFYSPVSGAAVYNSAANTITAVGDMLTPRLYHTATLLADGRVLVAGGLDDRPVSDPITNTAEIWGSATTGTISVTTDNSAATFTITGPATYTGSGTSFTQPNAPVGSYTVHYGAVSKYITPADQTGTLTAGQTSPLVPRGFYTPITIGACPAASPSCAQSLSFSYQQGSGKGNASQQVLVSSNGPPLSFSMAVSTNPIDGQWLSVPAGPAITPATVTVSVSSNMKAGTYPGTLTFASTGVTNSPQVLSVTLTVTKVPAPPPNTLPMHTYSIFSTKDNTNRTGVMLGTSPFASPLTGTTISTVIIPLSITIGSTVFDPTAPNSCDSGISAVSRFNASPLVVSVPLTFNGINVGTTQYVNGFRRAEFWSQIGGSSVYQNTLSPVVTAAVSKVMTRIHGITNLSGCSQFGIVSQTWLDDYLRNHLMPTLTNSGVISTGNFVIFLLRNVLMSSGDPPSLSQKSSGGYHNSTGNPVQIYAVADWDTTLYPAFGLDAVNVSHEIAEAMDDPLGTNPTPAWGDVGPPVRCQSPPNLEVGDPLSGSLMPDYTLGGKTYHMQELAFFSWFFNKAGVASLGAGGKFSGNVTFSGPSKVCPPGGTN